MCVLIHLYICIYLFINLYVHTIYMYIFINICLYVNAYVSIFIQNGNTGALFSFDVAYIQHSLYDAFSNRSNVCILYKVVYFY